MHFTGQTAIVTGASSGIGAELARQLAAAGARVGLMALPDSSLDATTSAIRQRGGEAVAVGVDVTQPEAVEAAVEQLTRQLGPVDLLILNAGVGGPTTVETFSAKAVERIVRVNLLGVANVIGAALPGMLRRRHGHLVGVSSLSSYRGQPMFSAYCASKAGVATLLEGLRIELRPYGIAVTTVRPGFVRTPMTAAHESARFMIEAEAAGRAILNGIAEGRVEVNFPWQSAMVMGLARWLPNGIYDRLTAKVMAPFTEKRPVARVVDPE
jgi:short-subunit dehydrogenase